MTQISTTSPVEHFLKDYQTPDFAVDSIELEFDLQPKSTKVCNKMQIRPLRQSSRLFLHGERLTLLSVLLNGQEVLEHCQVTAEGLWLSVPEQAFELQVVTQIDADGNTALQGLYRTNGNYCTQCEAEGFRNITYFMDRPDVLTTFTTKIIADKSDNTVLLSNGNLVESGDLPAGKHYALWHDPFPKPCYLFALVAGNLDKISDQYLAADGRTIALEIYVEPRNIDKCQHAMASLKKAMQWDEQRFGLIYDLDIYMIVAVDDFNMGAMENKGLNVFNSKFVLANPQTATDTDYEGIESVIAHEYFHNWTGNRVTCRDWFQLTLKEGLTVFRDQEFTADMLSPEVKRIEDVKRLRSFQFVEDAGPMQHPIQPQSYIEMNNFYTMTVYEKGSEIVRLYHTLLGEQGFQKGMQLYFQRHDGQAVCVEDFRNAMADANQQDLTQMHHWYVQAGTPRVSVYAEYEASTQTLRLQCEQRLDNLELAGKPHQPLLIPIKLGLLSSTGEALSFDFHSDAICRTEKKNEVVLSLTQLQQSFELRKVTQAPIPSLFRGFSAPVLVDYDYSDEELAVLASFDQDAFVRWESMQTLAMRTLKQAVKSVLAGQTPLLAKTFESAFERLLQDTTTDRNLLAKALSLPDLSYVAEQFESIDVDAILEAYEWLQITLAKGFSKLLKVRYEQLLSELKPGYRYHKDEIATRALKNVCLKYLSVLDECLGLAEAQYQQQNNMTESLAALQCMTLRENKVIDVCLQDFYQKWQAEPLVLDKWFSLQASRQGVNALDLIQELLDHPDFSLTNPNRVRSLLGVFARNNWYGFHQADGEGYQLLAQQILKLDAINPQIAARLLGPLTQWQRFSGERQQLMKQALESILAKADLSKDVFEIVSKSLRV